MDKLAERIVAYMPFVQRCKQEFYELGVWWSRVALTGKINSRGIATNLLDNMEQTKQQFESLQQQLITNLIREKQGKLRQELGARAQMTLDLLIRNLYERTADVGFLATDQAIRDFMQEPTPAGKEALHNRLQAYVAKYTVYDDLLLLTPDGRVCLQLQQDQQRVLSSDPLIQAACSQPRQWQEVFRASDLQQGKSAAHLFACSIHLTDEKNSPLLGVLCLSFDFTNEIKVLIDQLAAPGQLLALIDAKERIVASNHPEKLPIGQMFKAELCPGLYLLSWQNEQYLARSVITKGYEGYYGLPWVMHVMQPLKHSFQDVAQQLAEENSLICHHPDHSLVRIRSQALQITEDLSLAVLNGQILAARQQAVEFVPVLNEIRGIGLQTQQVFQRSITTLQQTVAESQCSDVRFRACTAIDIMDRNLYERANDVRWWALTHSFREALASGRPDQESVRQLTSTLAYINRLYTVYTSLLLFDAGGRVVATSTTEHREWIGKPVPAPLLSALKVPHSQAYAVTPFESTPLYDDRPTYIYLSSIMAPDSERCVGGLALVFDSEPQFRQMLVDSLPQDAEGQPLEGCWGVFSTPQGQVLASTHVDYPVGSLLKPRIPIATLGEEAQGINLQLNQRPCAVGYARSRGYREYKICDGYKNDLLAQIVLAC